MEPIQIFKKTEDGLVWEYAVLLGHESKDIGFLVKIQKQYWQHLTSERESPERLIKKCFQFLLKRQSKYSIVRSFDVREIHRQFPEFEKEVKKISFLSL